MANTTMHNCLSVHSHVTFLLQLVLSNFPVHVVCHSFWPIALDSSLLEDTTPGGCAAEHMFCARTCALRQ